MLRPSHPNGIHTIHPEPALNGDSADKMYPYQPNGQFPSENNATSPQDQQQPQQEQQQQQQQQDQQQQQQQQYHQPEQNYRTNIFSSVYPPAQPSMRPPPLPPPPLPAWHNAQPSIEGVQRPIFPPLGSTHLQSTGLSQGSNQAKQMFRSLADHQYRYALIVEQQPQRARMCGFGDKDRRPITPPPCIRLVITDVLTGFPVELNESDGAFFVLQVDLWDENADKEVNIVKSSVTSPSVSISTATVQAYPPEGHRMQRAEPILFMGDDGTPYQAYQAMTASGQQKLIPYHPDMDPPLIPNPHWMQPQSASHSSMFTRNLIGSLTVNASWLKDHPARRPGFWFVLQDLSVRTEGFFRLKLNFINVSGPGGQGLNRGRTPVLAWTFSDKFQVFSAKKFPGVIESTPLSKRFAQQGIKIPIRKDPKPDLRD